MTTTWINKTGLKTLKFVTFGALTNGPKAKHPKTFKSKMVRTTGLKQQSYSQHCVTYELRNVLQAGYSN